MFTKYDLRNPARSEPKNLHRYLNTRQHLALSRLTRSLSLSLSDSSTVDETSETHRLTETKRSTGSIIDNVVVFDRFKKKN